MRSLTNRLTLGLFDKPESEKTAPEPVAAPETPTQEKSWTNRLSFGLLDKPEQQNTTEEDAAN